MKIGEKYYLTDCSWSRIVNDNGELWDRPPSGKQECVLVAQDCTGLPYFGDPDFESRGDVDCIVFGLVDRMVIFTCKRFLEPATHTIKIDGKTVTLSHESYEDMKRQLT